MHDTYDYQLHTHTRRCKHASGDPIDYARVAHAGGCRVLGMSDHCPWPDGRWDNVRMHIDEFDDYVADVRRADAAFPDLRVLLSVEVEWVPELRQWMLDTFVHQYGCAYLIGAAHYMPLQGDWDTAGRMHDPQRLSAYTDYLIDTIASGVFAFIAHPDLFACSYANKAWDAAAQSHAHAVCAAAAAHNVPFELNGYGLRKKSIPDEHGKPRSMYPWLPFWEVAAEHGVEVVLNSDAHEPEDTLAGYAELEAMRRSLGLGIAHLPWLESAAGASEA